MSENNYTLKFTKFIDTVDIDDDSFDLPHEIKQHINIIGNQIENQKGVFTVLVTLFFYKIHNPKQDIRLFQRKMENGFSGRSFDTKHITPVLKKLNFPSMSESGWLTRSLEQPYPYDMNYQGEISNPDVKKSFLHLIDYVQKNQNESEKCLQQLIWWGKKIREKNKVTIEPLENPEYLTIDIVLENLMDLFNNNYNTHGGSKLPVICYHSLYKIILNEVKRYDGMILKELGYHTTSDRTSKSSGDIEIFQSEDKLFESLEIKYDVEIDLHIINRVLEKIYRYNPQRYYVLSTKGINQDDYSNIFNIIKKLKRDHGCQLIVNGIEPTLKYYLRLISSLRIFIEQFTNDILIDREIKSVHKKYWKSIIGLLNQL